MGGAVRPEKNMKGPASARSVSSGSNDRLTTGVVCLLLFVIVWIAFGQTLRHEFINYDDDQYVRENRWINNGLTFTGIQWAFTHVHAANWHPLTSVSHMLDCQLYGLEPWGHHLTNVILHAAAAVFLFLALKLLTGTLWPSAFVAALFAIHPLRVTSVAWIAERKDVLSGVFFMLTLWAYARYVRSDQSSRGRYVLTLVFFALGLMSKPTLVTLPFVLLLLDYWPLRRFGLRSTSSQSRRSKSDPATSQAGALPTKTLVELLIEKIPFFALSVGSSVATLLAQDRAVLTIQQLTFGNRVANAAVSYVIYIGQMIWPTGLTLIYPFPRGGWSMGQTIAAFLILLTISAVFFLLRRGYPFLIIGWLWFLGMLVPMIGIVQVGLQSRADRYTYLAQIGLYLLVTWAAMGMFSKWRSGRVALIAIALLIVATLMGNSYAQTSSWRDSETVWRQNLSTTPNNYIAENGLGDALMLKGKVDDAILHFRKALEICPDCWEVHFNLAHVLAKKGDWQGAITSYRASMRAWRTPNPRNHNDLGICLAQIGKTDEAIEQFNEALRIDGNFPDAHRNLAVVLLQLGRRDEAITQFKEVLRLTPNDPKIKAQLQQLEAGN